jgi:hypothetical protein
MCILEYDFILKDSSSNKILFIGTSTTKIELIYFCWWLLLLLRNTISNIFGRIDT